MHVDGTWEYLMESDRHTSHWELTQENIKSILL